MSWNRDLTLDDVLSDPLIGAALKADRVDPGQFEALLRATARRLAPARALPFPSFAGVGEARFSRRPAREGCPAW